MHDLLLTAMNAIAVQTGITPAITAGTFINTADNAKALSLPGSVYGFCVRLNVQERDAVFAEAMQYDSNKLSQADNWTPITEDIYPLYWGKDKMLGSRIYGHLRNHQTTGLARLCAYQTLQNREIACAVMTVNDNALFEKELHRAYPHLLKAVTRIL
jgi:hypothetical protein